LASQPEGVRASVFVEHIGITVPDVVAATHFFEEAFGAELVSDLLSPVDVGDPRERDEMIKVFDGLNVEALFGIPKHARLHAVRVLSLDDGPQLELFEFTVDGQRDPVALSDLGFQHIGIQVNDIDAAAARIATAGGQLFDGPRSMFAPGSSPGNRFIYTRAPWGMLIELVTYPSPNVARDGPNLG
jgi:catechol 2,3-dioxygenase-like lactoylglutathione lyase family enzyme